MASPKSSSTPFTLSSSAVSASGASGEGASAAAAEKHVAMPLRAIEKLDGRLAEVASSQSASKVATSTSSSASSKPGPAYSTPAHGSVHLDVHEANSSKSSGTLPYEDQEAVEREITGAMPVESATSTTSPMATSQNSKPKTPKERTMSEESKSGAMPASSSSGPEVYYIGNTAKKDGNKVLLPITSCEDDRRGPIAGGSPPLVQCTVPQDSSSSCTAGSSNARATNAHVMPSVDNNFHAVGASANHVRASYRSHARSLSRSRLCGGSPAKKSPDIKGKCSHNFQEHGGAMPVDRTPPTKRTSDSQENNTPRRKNASTGYAPKMDDQNTHDIVQSALAQCVKQFEERHAHLEAKHAKEMAEQKDAMRQYIQQFMDDAQAKTYARVAHETAAMRLNFTQEVQQKDAEINTAERVHDHLRNELRAAESMTQALQTKCNEHP